MAHSYQDIVQIYDALLQENTLPLFNQVDALPTRTIIPSKVDAPRVALFSPHPDDECLMGLLPLRLMQELGFAVSNIVVTLGSDPTRQAARWQELQLACHYLGFDVARAGKQGLHAVTRQTQAEQNVLWQSHIAVIVEFLVALRPDIIVIPHSADAHPIHCGTHALVIDALKASQHPCWVVQAEFWHPLAQPNVMVACNNTDLATLMTALACHAGEVSRNPYHLRLPAWMADNVRRGAEIIAGKGQAALNYSFATLYRIDDWNGERLITSPGNYFIAAAQSLAAIFQRDS